MQIDLNIRDFEQSMVDTDRVPELISKHGGRYLVQGLEPVVVEAEGHFPERSVILEFPSQSTADAFLKERSASDLHDIWAQSTSARILMLSGCT